PRSECDRLAELSGLFHSAGSVHLRGRGEVSVHLDVGDPAVTRRAFSLLRAFGVVSEIRTYPRHAFDRGTSRTVLLFEERAVMAATRSRANRLANADHANLVRTSRAAHDQLRAVERLRRSGELAKLPARLQEMAELRERHPTLSLRELALKCRPPATKASAYRRLRKLQELAST